MEEKKGRSLQDVVNSAEHVAGFDGVYVHLREHDWDLLVAALTQMQTEYIGMAHILEGALTVVNAVVDWTKDHRIPQTKSEIMLSGKLREFATTWKQMGGKEEEGPKVEIIH